MLIPDRKPLHGHIQSQYKSSFYIQSEHLFYKTNEVGFYHENSTPKDVGIFAPQDFSPLRKIPKILKSGITHMVTNNGGHTLHRHLMHSDRLSNSLFNRRTTKFQTSTQWPQASAL
jgi:hypothetical protein